MEQAHQSVSTFCQLESFSSQNKINHLININNFIINIIVNIKINDKVFIEVNYKEMKFYINHIEDTSIANNEKVLPVLHMELINDGRHDFHKFHEMIQNADITFSMVDIETGVYKIANSEAFIKKIDDGCCTDEYEVCYQFIKRQVNKPGTYRGWFTIKFGDDLKHDEYTYPEGTLVVPIQEVLEIIVR